MFVYYINILILTHIWDLYNSYEMVDFVFQNIDF